MSKISPTEIGKQIMDYTAKNSSFDISRDYVSLSHASSSPEQLINSFKNGFEDNFTGRLKCYKGYQMEKDLIERLKAIYGNSFEPCPEIVAFDGKVKGHPDCKLFGLPTECKSVLMDEWLPVENRVSKKIFWQMQAYMLYGESKESLVIFESRENGLIEVISLKSNRYIQDQIHAKYLAVTKELAYYF